MQDAIETYEHAGLKVNVYIDPEPMSPADWDNVGTLYMADRRDQMDRGAELPRYFEDYYSGLGEYADELLLSGEVVQALACRFSDYGSSGARLHVTDDWDDANAMMVARPANVEMCMGDATLDQVRSALAGEVDTWDQYFQGEVYGFVIEHDAPNLVTPDDSLWGMYDDSNELRYVKSEANEAAEYIAEQIAAENRERDFWAARDVETVA